MKVFAKRRKVFDVSGREIAEFYGDVEQVVELGEGFFVRVSDDKATNREDINRNIFFMDSKGKIVWRIPEQAPVYDESPFVDLRLCDNLVIVGNMDGNEYSIDPKTLQLVHRAYRK